MSTLLNPLNLFLFRILIFYGLAQKVYEVAHGPGLHHSSKFLMLLPVFQEKILQNDMGVIIVHYGTLGFLFPNNFPFCGYPT